MQTKSDPSSNQSEGTIAERLFQEYLQVNLYELTVSCFLEDSARYFGVFCEQDTHSGKDEKYLIN